MKATTTLVLAAMLVAPAGGRADDPASAFLTTALDLSPADLGRIKRGDVISRTLEATNRREVATLGVARIETSPEQYVERLSDIANFKRTADVVQIGTFSDVPKPADVAALTIDDADLDQLRACRTDDCDLRLSADAIERLHREVDWRMPDASATASRLLRRMLAEYVARYRRSGAAAAMEYADRAPHLDVGREFASLLAADSLTARYAPRLRRHLLEYPTSPAEKIRDFVYWSKELVRGRAVVSITHVAIAAALDDSPVAYAIGSKQIYAMHYYDASLGLTLLVPDCTAGSPATYVIYLNRSRIDVFDGLFGGIARRIVAGRARSLVAEQLRRLQRVLGPTASPDLAQRVR